jgi:hypothetical protein
LKLDSILSRQFG